MVRIAPLNGDKVVHLLCGAALTRAMAESATLEWKTYDESTLINVLYSLGSIWGKEKPGYAEVSIKSRQQLLPRYDEVLTQYMKNFATAMGSGPAQMHSCLERIERIRNLDREKLDAVARDAREINSEVAAELGEFVRQLAVVRAASTITLTLLGGGIAAYSIALGTGAALGAAGYAAAAQGFAATAATAGNIGLGYSISGAVVNSWYEVPSCNTAAITAAGELVKAKAWDLPGKLGEKIVEKAGQSREVNEKAVNFLNGAIRRRAQEVQMAASAQARQQGQRTLGRFHNANLAAHNRIGTSNLRAGAGAVLQGFMVVYMTASDIRSALEEYDKTVASSQ
jgi:hypothetical protein